MSYKVDVGRAGTPGKYQVYVDVTSPSKIEDGSAANPFKTIQAALNARPALDPADLQTAFWSVLIAPGVYDEDLVIPSDGGIYLMGTGGPGHYVFLGDPLGTTPRGITWNLVGSSSPYYGLTLKGLYLTGGILMSTSDATPQPELTVDTCQVEGTIGSTSIFDATRVTLTLMSAEVQAISLDGQVSARNSQIGGSLSCFLLGEFQDTRLHGLTVYGPNTNRAMKRCSVNGAASFSSDIGELTDVWFYSDLTISASSELRGCKIDGNATLVDCTLLEGCDFKGTLDLTGFTSAPRVYNSRITGQVTCINHAFEEARSSSFWGGVYLDTVPNRGFQGCYIAGNFTGPAGSYKVDGSTSAGSSVLLMGGATEDLVEPSGTGGTGGGGVITRSVSFSFTSPMGPSFYQDVAAPAGALGEVGSLFYNSSSGDIYLKTSSGWGTPVATAGTPFTYGPGTPFSYMGSDGDYYLDIEGAALFGPKAAGVWPAGTPLAAWTMVALSGITPTAIEGNEGDWGWSNDGTYIRIYGPKMASGWPTEYTPFLASGINTANISVVFEDPGFTGSDEIRVVGGSGTIYSNGSQYTSQSYNGYCKWLRRLESTGLTVPSNHLFIGAEALTTNLVGSGYTVAIGGLVGTDALGLQTGTGGTPVPGLNADLGTHRQGTAQLLSGGGSLDIAYYGNSYGSLGNIGSIQQFDGGIKFFFIPIA